MNKQEKKKDVFTDFEVVKIDRRINLKEYVTLRRSSDLLTIVFETIKNNKSISLYNISIFFKEDNRLIGFKDFRYQRFNDDIAFEKCKWLLYSKILELINKTKDKDKFDLNCAYTAGCKAIINVFSNRINPLYLF
ncbi:MAG: hypothetical protein ACOYM7_01360 [Paludibacter sp.]